MSLRPTFVHPRSRRLGPAGGPWDQPPLDDLLGPYEGVAALAGGLHGMGVGRGDVVAWQLPNGPEVVALYRACWRLGAVAAPVHHQAGDAEVARLLDPPSTRRVLRGAATSLPGGPPARPPGRRATSPSSLFTSGSSGAPKAVLHTQRALAYKARLMAEVHGLTAADAVLMPAPLAHISGLLNGVLVPGAAGMKVGAHGAGGTPTTPLDIIEAERITFMIGPPTFFVGLMARPLLAQRVRSLRLVSCGGAGVTPAFVDEAAGGFGCVVKRTYGSTEAPTVTTAHAGDQAERARTTDGRPTGEMELRIDATTGELLVRGPELFVGYADADRRPRRRSPRGWFRTGDLGTIDDDGWLTITGRLKDVIIRGGENIAAAEVEAAAARRTRGAPGRRRGRARRAARRAGRRRRGRRPASRSTSTSAALVRRAGRRPVQDAGARRGRRRRSHPRRRQARPDAVDAWR